MKVLSLSLAALALLFGVVAHPVDNYVRLSSFRLSIIVDNFENSL